MRIDCRLALLFLIIEMSVGFCGPAAPRECGVQPVRLRCEYLENPLGLDCPKPRFFWELQAGQRDQMQSAYRIVVADSEEALIESKAVQWDSGKVKSGESIQIEYAGSALQSSVRYFWKVRVWDGKGRSSAWSPVASFEMGLMKPEDWGAAQWIGRMPEEKWREDWTDWKAQEEAEKFRFDQHPIWDVYHFYKRPLHPAPLLRKEFILENPPASARVYICGLGYYELSINGQKVGDRVLDPAWTSFDQRALYATYDVTDKLRSGANAVGVTLGRGWYQLIYGDHLKFDRATWTGQPKCIMKLVVRAKDGTEQQIVTDPTWQGTDGPILFNCVRIGEIYDARQEKDGWDRPGYGVAEWQPACGVPAPKGRLSAEVMPPIRVVETVRPESLSQPVPGKYVYTMPFNMSGWARITTSGPAGTQVVVKYAESLNGDGTVNDPGGADRRQYASYVLKGQGEEAYEPRFAYYGFRYVQVEGSPTTPTLESLQGRLVHSDVQTIGRFECSNPLVNRLQENIQRTVLNNLHGIPTDCPHREKMGWMGDGHTMALSDLLNFDMALFYAKWVQDMEDAEGPEGQLGGIVPGNGHKGGSGDSPTWSGSYLLVPWRVFEQTGDRRIFETHYDAMKRFVDNFGTAKGHQTDRPSIIPGGWGDWVPPHNRDLEAPEANLVYGTAYYYMMAHVMSQAAQALGRTEDERHYAQLAGQIKSAMNKAFFDSQESQYVGYRSGEYLQATNAIALSMGMVPIDHEKQVLDRLVDDIMNKRGQHLDTGLLATKALMEGLPELERPDVAWALVRQTTYPSWGWQILKGATNTWECWDGASQMHPMFGVPSQFLFRYVAGIRTAPGGDAYRHVIIGPYLADDLTTASATIHTVRGEISSAWRREADRLELRVAVPANTTAKIVIPTLGWQTAALDEGGTPVWKDGRFASGVAGIHAAKRQAEAIVVEIGSGRYQFELRNM